MSNMERNIKITPLVGVTVFKDKKVTDDQINLVEISYPGNPGKVFRGLSAESDLKGARQTDLSVRVQFSAVTLAKSYVVVNVGDLMVQIPLKTLITEEILEDKGIEITRPRGKVSWININNHAVFELLFKSVKAPKVFHEGSVTRSYNPIPIVVPYKHEEPLIDPDKVEKVQEEDDLIPEIKFNSDKVDEEFPEWDNEDQNAIFLEGLELIDPYLNFSGDPTVVEDDAEED